MSLLVCRTFSKVTILNLNVWCACPACTSIGWDIITPILQQMRALQNSAWPQHNSYVLSRYCNSPVGHNGACLKTADWPCQRKRALMVGSQTSYSSLNTVTGLSKVSQDHQYLRLRKTTSKDGCTRIPTCTREQHFFTCRVQIKWLMSEKPYAKLLESSEKDSGPFIIRTAEFSFYVMRNSARIKFFG